MDVFEKEKTVLRLAQESLLGATPGGEGSVSYSELVEEYAKLFRQTRRMVTMGDRLQHTLSKLNHQLSASEEKFRGIFENVVEGIFRAVGPGLESRLVEANPALAAMFGCPEPEALMACCGQVAELFASVQERDAFARQLREEGAVRGFQAELLRPDGTRFWAQISANMLPGQSAAEADERSKSPLPSMVGVVADISERRRMLEEIYRLARTDSLTGLWNRGYFMDLARRELVRSRREKSELSLIMVDADHFKRVNDTHGHEAGDEALRCLSQVLSASVREVDLLARLGGEEFVILLPNTQRPAALAVAERIRRGIHDRRLSCASGACFCLTVSIGVACSQGAEDSLEHLLRCADAALYAAKHAGRNRVEIFEGAA